MHNNRLTFSLLYLAIVSTFFIFPAAAQQPGATPTPANANRTASPFEAFNMGAIYGQLMDGVLSQLEKPETAARLAKFQRQYFDALMKEGFSRDEALKILLASQVSLIPSSK